MYGIVRLEINQFVNHRQNGISFCFSSFFQPAYIFRSFLATRQPNLTGRTSLFLLSLINRNAHNNNAHSAGHKNMNKVVCVCLFLFVCLSPSLCLSVAFFLCFACQLAVNRLADKNVKCRPELASQPQPPLAALQLADCNLHRSSTALQSLCLHVCLPVVCPTSPALLLPTLTISTSYRQLVSAQPAGSSSQRRVQLSSASSSSCVLVWL